MAAKGVGDLTLFEALAGGVFDHLNCQHTREFDQIPRGLRGGMGSFVIDWYIMSATRRRLTGSLKPGFHMIATISTLALIVAIAEKKSSAIAAIIAIIWKPDFSEFAATTIAEIEPPFHVV